jgi:O-antigen ligase
MVVLLPLGLLRVWSERRTVLRVAAATATMFIAFGAVLTFSRGAALGFAITIVLMTALRYIKPSQLISLAIGVAVLFTLQPAYLQRLLTIEAISGATGTRGATQAEDNSFRKRANETIAAVLVFADHPVLGVGRGLFPLYYGDYADEVGLASDIALRQAHNLYAGVAAETGVFGFAFFMAIFGSTLIALARARRRCLTRSPDHAAMATGFFLAVVAYLTTGLFLHLAYERYLWILLALAGSAAYLGLQARLAEPEVPSGKAVPSGGRPTTRRPAETRRRVVARRPASG